MTTATLTQIQHITQDQLESVVRLEARLRELSRVLDARKEGIEAQVRAGVQVEEGVLTAQIESKSTKLVAWKVEFLKVMGPQEVKRLQDEAEPKLSERLHIGRA